MSIDIATALREEASKAREIAERVSSPDDEKVLVQLAAKLVEMAERLERDARD
jgi:metal-dependent HD superfamily phosphatase/phosphodiesterase